jgi:4a-hydroxytetrahydrobiopterin dehydratase
VVFPRAADWAHNSLNDMPKRIRLSTEDLQAALQSLPDWTTDGAFLHRTLVFPDFDEAWLFMNQVAEIARQMDHHPNWSNVYNRVEIALQTHDAGGITEMDLVFAQRLNQLLGAS